jgi:hypothetical protein
VFQVNGLRQWLVLRADLRLEAIQRTTRVRKEAYNELAADSRPNFTPRQKQIYGRGQKSLSSNSSPFLSENH